MWLSSGREIRGIEFMTDFRHWFGNGVVLLSDPTPHPIHAPQSTYTPLPSEGGRGGEEVLRVRRAGSPRWRQPQRLWLVRHLGKEVRGDKLDQVCLWPDEKPQPQTPRNGPGRLGRGMSSYVTKKVKSLIVLELVLTSSRLYLQVDENSI